MKLIRIIKWLASLEALMDYLQDAGACPQMTISCNPPVAENQKSIMKISSIQWSQTPTQMWLNDTNKTIQSRQFLQ